MKPDHRRLLKDLVISALAERHEPSDTGPCEICNFLGRLVDEDPQLWNECQ